MPIPDDERARLREGDRKSHEVHGPGWKCVVPRIPDMLPIFLSNSNRARDLISNRVHAENPRARFVLSALENFLGLVTIVRARVATITP